MGKSSLFACPAWTDGGQAREEEGEEVRRKDVWLSVIVYHTGTVVYDTLILPYEMICIW